MNRSQSYSERLAAIAEKPIFSEYQFARDDRPEEYIYIFGQNGLVAAL